MRISTIRHPEYNDQSTDFLKWRLCYKGGRAFIDQYLTRFSKREDTNAFNERRSMSYNPAFAKAGINKLKNTFYSRMSEITRIGGSVSYITACAGKEGGVDLYGTSMSAFMGCDVLEELMTMKKVGVFVDKPQLDGNLLARNRKKVPYLYIYRAEDILTWDAIYCEGEYVFTNLLLRDTNYTYDKKTGLVYGTFESYRHMWLAEDGLCHIQLYKENKEAKIGDDDAEDTPFGEEIILQMNRLPFVPGELKESLLADVADYQIGMMNIASADMNYCFKANFPFYTESYDPAASSVYTRGRGVPTIGNINGHGKAPEEGTAKEAAKSQEDDEINVGSLTGRKYPKGTDRPDFIAPPTEPLVASMKKQEQMKQDIFELIDIAASNAQPTHASAESKELDDRGLESGLSYIGLELEYMEREIAKIWALYEGGEPATVNYPIKYNLKSDSQRITEVKALNEVKSAAPSKTFSKEVAKLMSKTMLSEKIPSETLDKINSEIDAAEYITGDPEVIKIAGEGGYVDAETASNALGFNGKKVVPIAQKEHAERLALIAKSQADGAARGVPDKAGKQTDAKDEKTASQNPTTN